MAFTLGQALVYLGADKEKLKADLAGAKSDVSSWASGVASTVGTVMTGAVVAGAGIAVAGVAAIGKAAFGVAEDTKNAANIMVGEFDITAEEAKRTAEIGSQVWGNNFAGSIEDAARAVGLVNQQMGEMDDAGLKRSAENAIRLRDAFGIETEEGVSTAKTLMDEFGLSADQAFDFIAAGQQKGLNRSGDFLDTITEYSTQFSEAGANAGQFFSFLESGLAGGMLGTDKAADLFKEFRLRILDGSDATAAALERINLDHLYGELEDGQITVAEAFEQVNAALANTDDAAARLQIGAALMGTQFEDMGDDAVAALSLVGTSLDDLAGATDVIDQRYNSWPEMWEGLKRRTVLAIRPIGDALLNIANVVWPYIESAITRGIEIITPVFEKVGQIVENFFARIQNGMSPLDSFKAAIAETMSRFGVAGDKINPAIRAVEEWISRIRNGIQAAREFIEPIVAQVAQFVSWKDILILVGATLIGPVIGAISAVVASLAGLAAGIAIPIAAIATLRNAWENDWGGIQTKTKEAWETVIRPTLDNIGQFVVNTLIPTIQDLYQRWTEVWWPAISQAVQDAWSQYIQPTIAAIVSFVTGTLIPTISGLWTDWTTVWWPEIQTAIENAGTVINEVIEEVQRWIDENLRPIIEYFYTQWTTVWWPQIHAAITTAWGVIEPIFTTIQGWLNDTLVAAANTARDLMSAAWTTLGNNIKSVYDSTIGFVFTKIREFWDWLSSADFSFNFEIPDIPEWMIPGSPIPLHTYMKQFHDFLRGATFKPEFDLQQITAAANGLIAVQSAASGGFAGGSVATDQSINLSIGQLFAGRNIDAIGLEDSLADSLGGLQARFRRAGG